MSQEMNDLIAGLSVALTAEELALAGLQGIICGEIVSQRIKRGMNQKEFAKFMGVTQGMVSKWEKGDCNFTLQSLVNIATKLGISLQSPFVPNPPIFESSHYVYPFPGSWTTISSNPPSYESVDSFEDAKEE